ncbi:MAG: LacI family DNA-binding transcriptional regulator [Bacteroidales bacterium]|nr:LacI family DNA-binding transcriptional regulator [Bacteroidales bacterium]MDP3002947.1 LacI family DNA-binding transcriptional regulator [Bacteroidales bacterium]
MKKNSSRGIKEIAILAGVSIGTVDRILHNRGRVSAATQQKVKEIIKQINYKPNLLAKSLVNNKMRTVALLIPDHQQDEYWKQAYEGAENSIPKWEQQGFLFEPYLYSLDSSSSFEASGREILKSEPDGVIMAPNFLKEGKALFDQCTAASIPVIMFDTVVPDTQPLCFIGTDSFRSGMVAAELLHMTASREGKFAILHFDEELKNSPHMMEKERGFLEYLKKECPDRNYIRIVLNNKHHYYHGQLQKMFEKDQISGIFVSTSKTYRIGSYLKKEKINGIRLVGYDLTSKNIDLLKIGFIDFLINQNPKRQTEQSINTLCNYLIYQVAVDQNKLFPIEIIVRSNLNS